MNQIDQGHTKWNSGDGEFDTWKKWKYFFFEKFAIEFLGSLFWKDRSRRKIKRVESKFQRKNFIQKNWSWLIQKSTLIFASISKIQFAGELNFSCFSKSFYSFSHISKPLKLSYFLQRTKTDLPFEMSSFIHLRIFLHV